MSGHKQTNSHGEQGTIASSAHCAKNHDSETDMWVTYAILINYYATLK